MSDIAILKKMFAKLNANTLVNKSTENYSLVIEANGEKVHMWFKRYFGSNEWHVEGTRNHETRCSVISSSKLIRDLEIYAMNK